LSVEVKLCGVLLVGIPATECITIFRQLSGVSGGSVILDILAGGCFAVLGDKAYFVILGCPLGVNRGVARDGLGKVKLYGTVLVGIPAIERITLFRQLSGVFGGSVILNILAGGWVAVLGDKAYVVIVGCPLGSQGYIACGDSGKIKFFIAVVPACKGIVFFGRFRNKFCKKMSEFYKVSQCSLIRYRRNGCKSDPKRPKLLKDTTEPLNTNRE